MGKLCYTMWSVDVKCRSVHLNIARVRLLYNFEHSQVEHRPPLRTMFGRERSIARQLRSGDFLYTFCIAKPSTTLCNPLQGHPQRAHRVFAMSMWTSVCTLYKLCTKFTLQTIRFLFALEELLLEERLLEKLAPALAMGTIIPTVASTVFNTANDSPWTSTLQRLTHTLPQSGALCFNLWKSSMHCPFGGRSGSERF